MTSRVAKPAARAYMMSLLAVRKLQFGATFTTKFPNPWLYWEPGVWQPAKGAGSPTMIGGMVDPGARPGQGDALCFELAEPRPLKVGRAPECDVVLNDATVSREHVVLEPNAGRWFVKVSGGGTALLDERPLGANGAELRSRSKLRLGDVTLTFYLPADFVERLDESIQKATR